MEARNQETGPAPHGLDGLWSSSQESKAILDYVTDYFVLFDREWRYVYVNAQAAAVIGKPPGELIGKCIWDLYPPTKDPNSQLLEGIRAAMLSDQPSHFQAWGTRRQRWYDCHCYPHPQGLAIFYRDVTEQRRAEELRREAEQRAALIADSLPVLLSHVDEDYIYRYVNKRYEELFGKPRSEIVGKHIRDVMGAEAFETLRGYIEPALNGIPVSYEREVALAGGTRHMKGSYIPQHDRVTGKRGFFALVHDVTESRAAEDQLRQSDERLRFTLESAHVGTWDWNILTGEVKWSDNLEIIHGRLPGGFHGSFDSVQEDMVPEDRELVQKTIAHALESRSDYLVHYRVIKHDGSLIWVEGKGKAHYDDSGCPVRMVGICTDITERKKSEEALREREERYRLAARATNDVIWDWDLKSEKVGWNEALANRFGYQDEAKQGTAADWWKMRIHPDDQAEIVESIHAVIEGRDEYWMGEYRFRRSDGTYAYVLDRGSLLRNAEGAPIRMIGAMLDLTERKEAEEALRSNERELRRLNATLETRVKDRTNELAQTVRELEVRNRELQDFAYVASHDLQEPLRKVATFCGLLKQEYGGALDEQGHLYVDRMESAARRMSQLIHDLLSFSRVSTQAQAFTRIHLGEVLTEVLSDLETRIGETGGRIEVGDMLHLEADATQMRQLLQNLIGNALKFHREEEPPAVYVASELGSDGSDTAGAVCILTVKDNGIGFDPKYTDRIFAPFQRLHSKNRYEGTGIGLSICRRIVERHGGSIEAASVPGQGSTFTVRLPVKNIGSPHPNA